MDIIAQNTQSTVVAEYTPEPRNSTAYQSEAELENDFINRLVNQGYERIKIKTSLELVQNLRIQLEKLNNYKFSDKEWKTFFVEKLSNNKYSILEKTRLIQEDNVQLLTRDDNTTKNIKLIDTKNIHNNSIQVLNQYEEKEGTHKTRYDVTILVNGFPMVHIELKRRAVAIKQAFNQINRTKEKAQGVTHDTCN
ncbi:MAG: hypothetical protein ATN35_06720 [Epulopiscium sp. Nele67-Bin004]|nr:MAG: hypothetical protein ATN35_06720 [Epulopiscium sp. Nele67-Bin004]